MAPAVNVYFDRIYIGTREKLLKIGEHVNSLLPCASFAKQGTAVLFIQGGIAGKDVVFLLVTGLVANRPIRDDEIGECISRTPGVVTFVEDRLVKNQVYHDIGNVSNLMHGIAL